MARHLTPVPLPDNVAPLRQRARQKVREDVDQALVDGAPAPLLVMLENLTHWHSEAHRLEASDDPADAVHARIARHNAQRAAEAAAPFVHARLANVAVQGDEDQPVRHEHTHRLDAKSLMGKSVTELGALYLKVVQGEPITTEDVTPCWSRK
jgi:hypothetical protein